MSDPDDDGLPDWQMALDPGAQVTEDLGARFFAERYKNRLAYCHAQGAWLEYDGNIWRKQETPLAFHYAREMARRLSMTAATQVATIQKTRFAAGVEQFARADPVFARTAAHWNRDPMLLGTPDGTVDLRTGRLRPSSPVDNISRSTAIAPEEFEDCPTWHEFLEYATNGDEALARFLCQICGYSLTGLTTEQALFFVYGEGGRGKGVFVNTVTKILADYAVTAAISTFEAHKGSSIPADLAMLDGARLVTSQETEEGGEWAEARIKAMTGGDPITARFMRQNFFTYQPQFTLLIVGNHKPTLRTVDAAMKRRFNIIPFTRPPAKPDIKLTEKLQAEWPGILRWMINGCLDWQAHGLIRPQVVLDATAEYFEEQNTFEQWLDQECEVEKDNLHLSEPSSQLFASWNRYAKSNGIDPGNSKSFKPSMERAGFSFKKDRAGRWFHGLRLRPKEAHDDRDL